MYYSYSYRGYSNVDTVDPGAVLLVLIICIILGLLINMALSWGLYKKLGYKGWEGVVPFYNQYILCKAAGVDVAWFILGIFLPVLYIYIYIKLAETFGKSAIWGVGIFFLGVIFIPILGYGSAKYKKPAQIAKM